MHYYPIGVLTATWIFYLWDTYLSYRQYKVFKTTTKVPHELRDSINEETFLKAKAYSIDKARFSFISCLIGQIQSTVMIYYYLIPYFWNLSGAILADGFGFSRSGSIEYEVFQSLMFTFINSLASTIIELPISIYSTFVIEQKHGFNKQTAGFYAWDKLKVFCVSFLISSPVVAACVYIVRNGGPYFFLYLWMFCFVIMCLLTFFHGEIAALFDKFTPLPAGELRDKIENMARSVKFSLTDIYVVEGSKRSAHSNAYQSGIFNRKRIVIYDTLIAGYKSQSEIEKEKEGEEDKEKPIDDKKHNNTGRGCNQDEIIAILCHELGHWAKSHLMKNLAFAQLNFFLIFLLFSKFHNDPTFYAAFGCTGENPVVVGLTLLLLVLLPYNELLGFISTVISRHFEYEADDYAREKGHAEYLKTALIKLNIDNLGFPVYDELYSKFNHSHPTLMERLRALTKLDKNE